MYKRYNKGECGLNIERLKCQLYVFINHCILEGVVDNIDFMLTLNRTNSTLICH